MKKLLIIFAGTIIISIFGITQYQTNTNHLALATLQNPMHQDCDYINIGTLSEPNYYVDGWCPISHEPVYFIRDIRVVVDSLIIFNIERVQDNLQTEIKIPPICRAVGSGVFVFPTTTFRGFILSCEGAAFESTDSLRYTVL